MNGSPTVIFRHFQNSPTNTNLDNVLIGLSQQPDKLVFAAHAL